MQNLTDDPKSTIESKVGDYLASTQYAQDIKPDRRLSLKSVAMRFIYERRARRAKADSTIAMLVEPASGDRDSEELDALQDLGVYYMNEGKLKEAEEVFQQVWMKTRELLAPQHLSAIKHGPDNSRIVESLKRLAQLLISRDKGDNAEDLYRRESQYFEKALGQDHRITLEITCDFAKMLFWDQGKAEETEMAYRQALTGYEGTLGLAHPSALNAIHGLTTVLWDQSKDPEAEMVYRQALQELENKNGQKDVNTLASIDELAYSLKIRNKHDEAEELLCRVLQGYESSLGPDHPDTLKIIKTLAHTFLLQNRYDEAEKLYCRALQGYEKCSGSDHPENLRTIEDLAYTILRQHRYDEAENLYRRALRGYEYLLGSNHPNTVGTIEGYENSLGSDHPDTFRTIENLAITCQFQRRYDEAERLYRQALQGFEKILGPDHPNTLTTIENLAHTVRYQHRYDEAEKLYRRALDGNEKLAKPDHEWVTRLSELLEQTKKKSDSFS